jgi:hypothetical protein
MLLVGADNVFDVPAVNVFVVPAVIVLVVVAVIDSVEPFSMSVFVELPMFVLP